MSKELSVITDDIYGIQPVFERVAVGGVAFEREAGFAIQSLQNNSYALKVAYANRQSVVDAVTNVAAIGISLNPARKQAYLVPRDNKICLDISYMGLMDLAISSGSILWGQSEIVHQQDVFEIHGFDKPPTHTRNPFATEGRGEIIGAYVVVKTKDGDYLTTAMPITEIYNIRARSAAYKKSQGPWVTDPGEMIKKTVIKRAYKMWPKTERLDAAIQYLNTEGGEGIVLDAAVDTGFDLEAALKDVAEAETQEALDAVWLKHGALATKAKDREGYKSLKKACQDRKAVLEGKA